MFHSECLNSPIGALSCIIVLQKQACTNSKYEYCTGSHAQYNINTHILLHIDTIILEELMTLWGSVSEIIDVQTMHRAVACT